jgi:PAS domain S-box-containing protein
MNDIRQSGAAVWLSRRVVVALVVILAGGALLTWWTVKHADQCMREDLLFQARLVAEALNPARVQALLGTEADLHAPDYFRLKEQLASAKTVNEKWRFLYLLGRRADRGVFFFVDSEPAGSKLESPAGQIYWEITADDLRAFDTKAPLTSGPATDRWGTWISALVPLSDPDTGDLVAVLGLDYAAHDWKRLLLQASLPPILLTLCMTAILVIGSALFVRGARLAGLSPGRYRYPQPTLVVATVGLFLSIAASWLAQEKEAHARRNAFQQLASDRTAAIAGVFHTLHDIELEALVRFIKSSEVVSPAEFRDYTGYLVKNPAVMSWEWVQPVPEPDRDRLEAQIRDEGLPGFAIWQKDAQGNSVPAAGRNMYYPVVRVASMAGNDQALGHDLGSEPLFRAPLEEAMRTGLATCSDPVRVQGKDGQKAILTCRPVFIAEGHPSRLLGFVLAVLNMDDVLARAHSNAAMVLELTLVRPEEISAVLAASWHGNHHPGQGFFVTRPVFAFGKTFLVNAYPNQAFMSLYPLQAGKLVALLGLLLTAIVVVLTGVVRRERQQLELEVAERTAELADAKHRMELAICGADLGTWDWEVSTGKVTFNERMAEMLGYSPHEIEQHASTWEKIIVPEDMPETVKAMTLHLQGKTDFYEMEHRLQHKAGQWIWVLAKGRATKRDDDGSPLRVCGTYLDITKRKQVEEEQKKLEDHLAQVHKLEAIGRLAGGVAHDLNNLLSPIIGYGEMILADLDRSDPRGKSIDAILRAGYRARDLVGQLLSFSRKQAMELKPLDINKTIRDFEPLLRRTIPEDIEIRLMLAPHAAAVMADVVQIDQVIMNLVVNAADAMPDGGQLTIETVVVELDEEYAARHIAVQPGQYLMLAVSDTGCGMDEKTRERIFEPFYSTKGEQGTGLGLATVFGIVKQHGGNIWVYSETGLGTTFKIYLPVAEQVSGEREISQETAGGLTGTETILLVEDNEEVRHLASAILDRQGYTLHLAKNGTEALEIMASLGGQVDLLLTDVVMPGMNGKELYQKAASSHPHLKVLFMSGYTDNVIAHRGVLEAGIAYLQKPFTVQAISEKVRKVLDQ